MKFDSTIDKEENVLGKKSSVIRDDDFNGREMIERSRNESMSSSGFGFDDENQQPLLEKVQPEDKGKQSCLDKMRNLFGGPRLQPHRTLYFNGNTTPDHFTPNQIRNQKYSIITFVPVVLFNQFKFFFNLFFLMIALSQFIKALKVGFLFTYVAPLVFVLLITMLKEAYDDFQRYRRDKEMNSCRYVVLTHHGPVERTSEQLKVGNIVKLSQDERVPADILLLKTSEKSGCVFIRTDQLDGETDWKKREAITYTQKINDPERILDVEGHIIAKPPTNEIYNFEGTFVLDQPEPQRKGLSNDNTLWANTVLATGVIYGMVLYTGKDTRAQMNSKQPRSKVGKLDMEINKLSKILFGVMVMISFCIVMLNGFNGQWFILLFRYVLLLSSIIPISLRVNLDLAKIWYSVCISKDTEIPGTIARNSTIPEELGRIQFLLTDKTGTLTQNDMVFKRLTTEDLKFTHEAINEIKLIVQKQCQLAQGPMADMNIQVDRNISSLSAKDAKPKKKNRRDKNVVVRDLITALALCNNVTPVYDKENNKTFQASSPDEVALVKFAEELEMRLIERDQRSMKIMNAADKEESYEVLANFPFTSESKRMGIVLKHEESKKIIFYLKGAEVVMQEKVNPNQKYTVREECEDLAREGLRTLVISQKLLSEEEFEKWSHYYEEAKSKTVNRDLAVRKAIEDLEVNMDLLGITGVEDKLQEDVQKTLESLRNAGINIWMLTGDKVETATCIAISAGLKDRAQGMFLMKELDDHNVIEAELNNFSRKSNCVLIIDGSTLANCIAIHEKLFFETATKAPAVVCCRVSPLQKAEVVNLIKKHTQRRTCAIGDGGNDVGMILAADVGVGIVGKEGKQASLAADFSINQFSFLSILILWHGRLSYKRSSVLSQFVIHRGLIISVIQSVFIILFYFVAIAIYNGYLMLGYTTIYTSLPVFSLVFDEDADKHAVLQYPVLYKSLQKGRALSFKTFLSWVWKSIYQGSVIMLLAISFFNESFVNIVSITFSALIIIEILNVFSTTHKPTGKMIVMELSTVIVYFLSFVLFRNYFDLSAISVIFLLKVLLIVAIAWVPIFAFMKIYEALDPSEQKKVMDR